MVSPLRPGLTSLVFILTISRLEDRISLLIRKANSRQCGLTKLIKVLQFFNKKY